MAPHSNKSDDESETQTENDMPPKVSKIKHEIYYVNVTLFLYLHLAACYGLYLCYTKAKWATIISSCFMFVVGDIGITAGAHRLWSHRSYKAKLPMQIMLMIFNSIAFQYNIMYWARDHRLHHKYCDTDADPYNASRGFFYSHIGWLLTKKNKEVLTRGKLIEVEDLYNNPVLRFQRQYALPVFGGFCFILPTILPMYLWGESFNNAYHINILRFVFNFNAIFFINSAAHLWGYKPYDQNIRPTQNMFVSLVSLGEGFHNYHHVFPWDYKASELGNNMLNISTLFIDACAKIGWAYDLKTVRDEMIKERAKRTGDGTNLWGWDDKDMTNNDKKYTEIFSELQG